MNKLIKVFIQKITFLGQKKIIERSNTARSQEEWNDLFDEYIKAAEEDVKRAKKHYDDAVELALHKRILIKEKATIIHDELICNVKMTELEIFAKFTNEHGGEWWLLEKCGKYSLCMSKGKYLGNNCHRYFTTPVYQIFKDGKRIYTNTNYCEASCIFNDLMKQNDI